MKTEENIFKIFIKEICSNCKKKESCQEELRRRIDNSVKCYEYERENNLYDINRYCKHGYNRKTNPSPFFQFGFYTVALVFSEERFA